MPFASDNTGAILYTSRWFAQYETIYETVGVAGLVHQPVLEQ